MRLVTNANASPRASIAVVLVLGARPNEQASLSGPSFNTIEAARASVLSCLPVMAIVVTPNSASDGSSCAIDRTHHGGSKFSTHCNESFEMHQNPYENKHEQFTSNGSGMIQLPIDGFANLSNYDPAQYMTVAPGYWRSQGTYMIDF